PRPLSPAPTEVFQWMGMSECHFSNGTDRVRFVERYIYNRKQDMHFDSDVGEYEGDTPFGEIQVGYLNSDPERLEYLKAQVNGFCRYNYELSTPFLVSR
ncbi:HB2L protein, partial [Formicarius rufipectus]|nr:HB2L protein [Formicarius rufipectus]